MESDVCETLDQCQLTINFDILLCVYFCHRTKHCRDLVYGQQSGHKTTVYVYVCVHIIYMYHISLSFHAFSKDWWFLPEHS